MSEAALSGETKSKMHLLFLCSSNLDRSPAAAYLFKRSDKYEAKSAGLGPFARTIITKNLIDWADHIFVMDERKEKHRSILVSKFPDVIGKDIVILEISNNYCRNDPRLFEMLKIRISNWLRDYCIDDIERNRIKEIDMNDWID